MRDVHGAAYLLSGLIACRVGCLVRSAFGQLMILLLRASRMNMLRRRSYRFVRRIRSDRSDIDRLAPDRR